MWYLVSTFLRGIKQKVKSLFIYTKLYLYAQWYLLRKLLGKPIKEEARVRPWLLVNKFLDDEWVRLVREEEEEDGVLQPLLRQPYNDPMVEVTGPLSQFHTALSVHERLKSTIELQKCAARGGCSKHERWATPEVSALLKEAVAEAVIGLSNLRDVFPLRGAAYFTADFLNFVKQHMGEITPDDQDLMILKQHIEDLLYIDAIQVFIKLHGQQNDRYKNLLKCFARIFVESQKEIHKLNLELEKATTTIRENWYQVETSVFKAVNQSTRALWNKVENQQGHIQDFKEFMELRLNRLSSDLSDLRQKSFESQNVTINRFRQLQLDLTNLQTKVEQLTRARTASPQPEEGVEIHAPAWDKDIDENWDEDSREGEAVEEIEAKEPIAESEVLEDSKASQDIPEERKAPAPTLNAGAIPKRNPYYPGKPPPYFANKPRFTHVRSEEAKKKRREKYRVQRAFRPMLQGEILRRPNTTPPDIQDDWD